MKIIGTGSFLPKRVITNEELEASGRSNAKWIEERLGIKERRQTYNPSSVIGTIAGENAIESAGLKPRDIDMIIVATATPDKITPSTAVLIQDTLGTNAACFDINAVCTGFVYAMAISEALVSVYKHILIIGVDTFSRITDWKDRNCVFFGDGAGAVVVTEGGYSVNKIYTDSSGVGAFVTEHGGTFEMKGKEVFKAGTMLLPIAIRDVLRLANMSVKDIDWMLPHQASVNMLKTLAVRINFPWEKVKTNMDKYANTAAASIPILLAENEFKQGDRLLLAAIGSGWTYGAMIIEW